MKNIAVFASGSGSNAENIARYFESSQAARVVAIVSNKADALVHERAKRLAIDSVSFSKADFEQTDKVVEYLATKKVDFIVLAGFLLKVPANLLQSFPHSIINIHPALLPKYGGKGMYGDNVHKAVVAAGESKSGITIHYVNENYDEGAIVFQAECEVLITDTYEDVAKKVHELEYKHFPAIIEKVLI